MTSEEQRRRWHNGGERSRARRVADGGAANRAACRRYYAMHRLREISRKRRERLMKDIPLAWLAPTNRKKHE